MNFFLNMSLDGADTFCSTIGNELIIENNYLLIPCFNMGFYENAINKERITLAYDKTYLLFNDVMEFNTELSLYNSIYPDNSGVFEFSEKKVAYNTKFNFHYLPNTKKFYLEGVIYRHNSFSYGSYSIIANSLTVVLPNEAKLCQHYTSNDSFKTDHNIQAFLLNKTINNEFIKEVII